jgi:AraC-like DNA-binding protein
MATTSDYFRYFPGNPLAAVWGLRLTASGHTHIAPGVAYPAVKHPSDHHFTWRAGRELNALQVVLITDGRGILETRGLSYTIRPGDAFLVLPRGWHRYRPDPETGWVESWMEVEGPVVRRLLRAGVLSQRQMVRGGSAVDSLESALTTLHTLASASDTGADPSLSAAAYGVLAAWDNLGRPRTPHLSRVQRSVLEAERHINTHLAEPISIAALAKRVGVAYSQFRQAFREQTGFSPWQYVLRLRLAKVRQALAHEEDAKLEEISQRFGFSSAFHLSVTFKRVYGISPSVWRQQSADASPQKPPAGRTHLD